MLTKPEIIAWLERFTQVLAENKEYLTELDSAIGDADHGSNMDRGFRKVAEKLPSIADSDIGNILKSSGMTLMSSVGGASGPLYGTFFMRGGQVTAGKDALTDQEVVDMLQAGVDGVVHRGRAVLEDKTMFDTWQPTMAAFQAAVTEGQPLKAALSAALAAAEAGMKATIPLQARKGRASYLGERSIGHQDPGATSSYLMIQALYDTVAE